jgi:peptidoglycan hydrolase CwlO-like protein
LKAVIAELVTATEIAERAIGGLKHTVRDVNEHLGAELNAAHEMSDHLKKQLAEAEHVVRRLSKIALAARPSSAAEPAPAPEVAPVIAASAAAAKISSAKAVAAAAQAFSERRRASGLAA